MTDGQTDGQTQGEKQYVSRPLQGGDIITLTELAPSPYSFLTNICLVYMNVFARFDEIHSMTLQNTWIKIICTYKSH